MEINKDLVKATGDITTGDISFSTIHSKNLLNFGGTRSQSKLGMTLSYNPNTGILTFYKEYLQTIEVVEFKKDRNSFNKL